MDGIRGSRPLGSGGPFGSAVDDVDGLWPRDDFGLGPAPSMPIDAPSGWFHREDGVDPVGSVSVDLADGLTDSALWALGGPPAASPLLPGDGIEWSSVAWSGFDAVGSVEFRALAADGVDFAPLLVEEGLALDGVDAVDDAPLWFAPFSFAGLDAVDFSGDEGVGGGTFFPAMYRTDPLDGADPAPEDALPPAHAPHLDGVSFTELQDAGFALEDDAIFIPEIEPLAVFAGPDTPAA